MDKIPYSKFHGTANDFIIINQLDQTWIDLKDKALIQKMCSRRFGIGADGLMVIEKGSEPLDFVMHYFNADGAPSSMCGNGGRCISLAYFMEGLRLAACPKELTFGFKDAIYHSTILDKNGTIRLKMQDVNSIESSQEPFVLDTGSPHYVSFKDSIESLNVSEEGAKIRYSDHYKLEGINVNFCEIEGDILHVRTYERGVEDETYSCGTGVVASAIAMSIKQGFQDGDYVIPIRALGGELEVHLRKNQLSFSEIYLVGPAVKVSEGWYLDV